MKRYSLVAVAMLGGLLIHAQSNAPGAPPAPRAPTLINSDSADFDLNGHQGIYCRHVRVDDPQMKLTCEKLVADLPQTGGHPNHIVAETNVVIDFLDDKGRTNHATGDKAVYLYSESGGVTNETVTLTGNPQMENAQGTLNGDVIVWDRLNNRLSASNQRMIFRQNLTNPAAGTSSPPAKTDVPPGTVENIDKNISNHIVDPAY